MLTKITVIRANPAPEPAKKPIEFTHRLDVTPTTRRLSAAPAEGSPHGWNFIDLVARNYCGLDLMLAYDDANRRGEGIFYIGHFNDGVV